jgi:hypothetical protein
MVHIPPLIVCALELPAIQAKETSKSVFRKKWFFMIKLLSFGLSKELFMKSSQRVLAFIKIGVHDWRNLDILSINPSSQDIAELLVAKGFEVDKRKILLTEPIKALGFYEVPVKLHTEVQAVIKVWVVKQ